MNRSNATTLIVAGLVGLLVGSLAMHFWEEKICFSSKCPDKNPTDKAKYVVCFGDCAGFKTGRVSVVAGDIEGFKNALENKTVFHSIDVVTAPNGPSSPLNFSDAPPPPLQVTPSAYIRIAQRKKSSQKELCNMHVTQKAGFNSLADMQGALELLDPQQ